MENWLNSLFTETPQDGFELAIKLSRMGVKYTQPTKEILKKGREQYGEDAQFLITASHVIATNFRTIADTNNYWLTA
ncbi:MAG: hexameric tyrosine-coordinated heme protein [Flavobacteriaceae bacterium]|nr:hexameric tyrosine-coordinated heme protein [Flavobacteriaceae bacterium]